jgi:hypothetical protein
MSDTHELTCSRDSQKAASRRDVRYKWHCDSYNLYTCLPIWAKFCIGHPYESPLRNCELREDGLSKNCCLIKDVQYMNLRPYFVHSSSNVDKIQCRTRPRKLSERE